MPEMAAFLTKSAGGLKIRLSFISGSI